MENMADLNATFRQLIMLASGLENVILAGQTGKSQAIVMPHTSQFRCGYMDIPSIA
jgi:hypothetical protein